jgi:hypothetical protein
MSSCMVPVYEFCVSLEHGFKKLYGTKRLQLFTWDIPSDSEYSELSDDEKVFL